MKKSIVLIAIMALLYPNLYAQSDADALRYSLTDPIGSTARSMGTGGAFGAVGADPSSVLHNPAGLAQYKTDIFSISLGTLSGTNVGSYLNSEKQSTIFKANMPSLNLIFTNRKMVRGNPQKVGWVNYNFAIGYNRTADYNRTVSYNSTNTQNSYLDGVAGFLQGTDAGLLDANDEQLNYGFYYFDNMFWYAYLIDSVSNGNYAGNYDTDNTNFVQNGRIATTGGMAQYNLSYAANYEHKFYIGLGLDIHQIRYTEKNVFEEQKTSNYYGDWTYYEFERNLETKGYGFSGRLGMTYLPNPNLRLGATVQTAKILTLTDTYQDKLNVAYSDNSSEALQTVEGEFEYQVFTPTKYALQGAYFFGKKGFISTELETINYGTMNIASSSADFDDVNDNISSKYKNTANFKIGGEYVFDEMRVRAGYAFRGDPFANSTNQNRQLLSAGIGMHEKRWGIDVGVVKDLTYDEYVPYQVPGAITNGVQSVFDANRLVLTITSKF